MPTLPPVRRIYVFQYHSNLTTLRVFFWGFPNSLEKAGFPAGTVPDHLKVTNYFPSTFWKNTGRWLSHLKGSWSQPPSSPLKETPDRSFTWRHFISKCHQSPINIWIKWMKNCHILWHVNFLISHSNKSIRHKSIAELLDHLQCSESITAAVN